jgi:hypothetical protein
MRSVHVALLIAACLAPVAVTAAPDAGAKARGSYNFYGNSSHNAFSSARSHVQSYQGYLRDTHGVAIPAHAEALTTLPSSAVVVDSPATSAARVVPSAAVDADVQADVVAHGAVDPEVAREASDAIGDDIERIQRHLKRMRKHAEELGDTEALPILDSIEKNLAVARRGHADLHGHHAEESIAPETAMKLAQKVNDALRAAHADHDKLMRRLHEAGDPAGK